MNLDHIFVDITTSSLDPDDGEVLSIAAIRTDRNGRHLQAFQSKIKPVSTVINEMPKKGSDYVKNLWNSAPTMTEIRYSIHSVLVSQFDPKYVVVTHHVDLVRPFLKDMFVGRAWIDTAQLAWPMIANGQLSGRDLETLAKHFKVSHEESGVSAVGDCATVMLVYWALMARYKTALTGEELLRNAGGDTLASVRKWFRI